MNTRSFIKSLLVSCVAPQILLNSDFKWKQKENLWIPNPDWVNAEYEISFYERLPFYLAKNQVEKRNDWFIWKQFVEQLPYIDSVKFQAKLT